MTWKVSDGTAGGAGRRSSETIRILNPKIVRAWEEWELLSFFAGSAVIDAVRRLNLPTQPMRQIKGYHWSGYVPPHLLYKQSVDISRSSRRDTPKNSHVDIAPALAFVQRGAKDNQQIKNMLVSWNVVSAIAESVTSASTYHRMGRGELRLLAVLGSEDIANPDQQLLVSQILVLRQNADERLGFRV